MTRIFSWSLNAVKFIFFALAVALAFNALGYINFDPTYKFLRLKQEAIATGWYLPFYYSHVLVSGLILVIGFFQVSGIGRKWLSAHRLLGKVYVMGILFFAAPGGLVMSFFINRGPIVLASFLLQTVAWFIATSIAFNKIRQRNFDSHREWMWRSFAITCAAITLRLYILLSTSSYDLSEPGAYATIAWLSWIPNLIIAEIAIILRNNRSAIAR